MRIGFFEKIEYKIIWFKIETDINRINWEKIYPKLASYDHMIANMINMKILIFKYQIFTISFVLYVEINMKLVD